MNSNTKMQIEDWENKKASVARYLMEVKKELTYVNGMLYFLKTDSDYAFQIIDELKAIIADLDTTTENAKMLRIPRDLVEKLTIEQEDIKNGRLRRLGSNSGFGDNLF